MLYLLYIAVAFMFAALASCVVALAFTSAAAMYAMFACVAAAAVCVKCEDLLHKRKQVQGRLQRVVARAHTNSYDWM